MTRKSCIIYDSWGQIIKSLPKDQAGELIKAVCAYAFDDIETEISDPALSAIFDMIQKKLDKDLQTYEEKVERLKKNRLMKSARKDSSQTEIMLKSDRNQHEIDSVTVTDTVTDNNNIKVIGKRASAFTPPDVSEVRSYCQERHNSVDPERFVDFYASKGWFVGKNKMKDWKAAVRNWEKGEAKSKPITQVQDYIRSDYDIDAIERALVKNG